MAVMNVLDELESGQVARLIPTVADSKREERATSSLLASFMVVPGFAKQVLAAANSPVGKRVKVTCYTEVVFKTKGERRPRPDGLIVVTNGSTTWTALVEAKIGNADLKQEQVEEYLDVAKALGIDAVITISNQFSTLPTHHPLSISKQRTRAVGLFHFSWLSLVSQAGMVSEGQHIDDPEQSYILNELVRYLQHESSGVTALTSMGKAWKELCNEILQGTPINRKASYVEESVASWQQLLRYLSIRLSVSIGKCVTVNLSRARANDASANFEEDVSSLLKDNALTTEFDIPNAASRVSFTADILRRTIVFSMKLVAPKDKSRATASINWFTRQIKGVEEEGLTVRAHWPKRIRMTSAPLGAALEDPKVLIPENVSDLPVALEVVRIVDLAARFKGSKTFVEEAEKTFPEFYRSVGQRLLPWIAKPPKVKEPPSIDSGDVVAPAGLESPMSAPIPQPDLASTITIAVDEASAATDSSGSEPDGPLI